jgi:hypothetical protein
MNLARWSLAAGAALLVFATAACAGAGDDAASRAGGAEGAAPPGEQSKSIAPDAPAGGTEYRDALGAATPAATGGPQVQRQPASGDSTTGSGQLPASPEQTTLDRKIIFNARLALTAEDVPASFDRVSRIARTAGGFIEKSSLATRKDSDGEERPYASLTLRVPTATYQDTLGELRALPGGKVGTEESGSNEVTEQYTDLQSRLRNLERTEQRYLALLEQATTIPDILTVNDRLDSVRLQIERIQGQLKVFDDLVELATIDVSLAPVLPGKPQPADDGPKSVREAFADAWAWSLEAGRYVAAGLASVLAVAIWLAIPAALVLGAAQVARRRRPHTAA